MNDQSVYLNILIKNVAELDFNAFDQLKKAITKAEYSTGPRRFGELLAWIIHTLSSVVADCPLYKRKLMCSPVLTFCKMIVLEHPDMHHLMAGVYNTHAQTLMLEKKFQAARKWLGQAYSILRLPKVSILDKVSVYQNLGVTLSHAKE